jgi:hypothetical protein
MKSAVLFGWEDRNGLVPVYFKGQMSSDFLQDLVCTYKGNKFTGGIYRFISVTICKGGQISKVFWTVFKYFKNGSFANP